MFYEINGIRDTNTSDGIGLQKFENQEGVMAVQSKRHFEFGPRDYLRAKLADRGSVR